MTTFAELVGCRLPVQLAGMGGGISDVSLATAVCEAGGLGMLGAAGLTPVPELLEAMPDGLSFGVNFLMPFVDPDAVKIASSRARVVEFFYGDPDEALVSMVHDGGALAAWQVGSSGEAAAAVAAGCDFVVAQGTEAGGHVRGKLPLAELLAQLDVSVPVVAAGGIGTAKDVARVLSAGATGVRIGTRFLAANESCAHPLYVSALVASSADDTTLTETFSVGWPDAPHRVLSSCIEQAEAAEDDTIATLRTAGGDVPLPRLGTIPPTRAVHGRISAMPLYAGTSVGAVTGRVPAADIVAELLSGL